jgi:hypothetical protein
VNEKYKDKLEILRQRIPIGLRQGLVLLEKYDGDLDKAEKQFQSEMLTLIIDKTGVSQDLVIVHLIKNRFDIGLTIKSIDEERYTLTELILRNCKDKKEDALEKIMHAVEEVQNLKRTFWLNFDDLKVLPSEIYCFLTTMEWLNYESWEDYGSALSFNLDIVVEQIEHKLELPDLANSLRQAKNIQTIIYRNNEASKHKHNDIMTRNELRDKPGYQKCEEDFKTQRPILIERLYELVIKNKELFP